jgi:hypothetical protein
MSLNVFSNNGSSLLASGITAASGSVTVTAGQGALFPAISAGQQFVGTLEDTSGNLEIVIATARVSDTISITRAQENTTAAIFASGSRFELRATAGVMGGMLQKSGGDTLSGTTTNNGVIQQNTTGSIQGGEYTGAVRGAPGQTANQITVPVGSGPATMGGSVLLTAANFLGNLPSGVGVFQTGMICLWSGSSASIPAGYHACDGTNGTPDLRDKFVLGAGGSLATSGGATTSSSDSAGTPAITPTSLTVAQLPVHNHTGITGDSTVNTGSIGTFMVITNNTSGGFVSPRTISNSSTGNTGNGDPHGHSASALAPHSHTIMPPYTALFFIMKL